MFRGIKEECFFKVCVFSLLTVADVRYQLRPLVNVDAKLYTGLRYYHHVKYQTTAAIGELDFFAVVLHTCIAVKRSLCVSWAFLYNLHQCQGYVILCVYLLVC